MHLLKLENPNNVIVIHVASYHAVLSSSNAEKSYTSRPFIVCLFTHASITNNDLAIFSNSTKTPTDKIYISGQPVKAIPSTPHCFNFADTRTFEVYHKPLADVKQFVQ